MNRRTFLKAAAKLVAVLTFGKVAPQGGFTPRKEVAKLTFQDIVELGEVLDAQPIPLPRMTLYIPRPLLEDFIRSKGIYDRGFDDEKVLTICHLPPGTRIDALEFVDDPGPVRLETIECSEAKTTMSIGDAKDTARIHHLPNVEIKPYNDFSAADQHGGQTDEELNEGRK